MNEIETHFHISVVTYAEAEETIQAIRRQVFQREQQVAPEIDFDGLDEETTHLIAYQSKTPIATTRIRQVGPGLAKIERVAVLAAHRNQGVGREMVQAALDFLTRQTAIAEVKVNSQLSVQAFYQKLGFEPWGEVFEEAGILHIEMRKKL
jgi:predicted GNAT family N-acyltransferase